MPPITSPTSTTQACVSRSVAEGAAAPTSNKGKLYWRSLEDLADTQEFREFMHREFPAGSADLLSSSDRRQFLKVMGASLAFAGLGMAGCRRWPEEKIAPFAHRPANRAPGVPVAYATMMELGGVAHGLLVTSYDGRPIKIEGNPLHPINQGSTDAIMQASILDLYDPDRSRSVIRAGKKSDWASFVGWAKEHFAANKQGVAVLGESTSSPAMQAMRQRVMQTLPGATWHEYEPLHNDNEINGSKFAFGSAQRFHYNFDQAKTIVSLDSDFLHCQGAAIKWSRDFAKGRRVDDQHHSMNRLYAFESGVSLTGAAADHRVALRSADVALIAAKLAVALAPNAASAFGELANSPIATSNEKLLEETLAHAIADLQSRKPSIVIAGPRQPAEVHMMAAVINEALGNFGKTITLTPMPEAIPHLESMRALAANIAAGKVQTLIILGGNPAYNGPADLNFADAIKNIANVVHLSDYVDETSQLASANGWHVNRAHYLEAWGDGLAYDGTYSVGQPLIQPLFEGKSAIEVLAAITGDELTEGYDIVRRTFMQTHGDQNGEVAWRTALHDGLVKDSAPQAGSPPQVQAQSLAQAAQTLRQRWTPADNNELEVVFVADNGLYDGRFANNAWLQELPDPIAKLTWDNAALISPAAAAARGLRTGDMVRLKANGRELDVAVMVIPGQYSGSATIALGYGREFAGRIAAGAGFNAYKLRSSDAMSFVNGSLSSTGETYVLASTQDHQAVDTVGGQGVQERLPTLFREGTLSEFTEHPDFAKHRTHVVHRLSLWEEDFAFQSATGREGARYAWAMSIDLNACTGCNACVVACQSENNIPVVGKDQVKRGREMHWIRVDRYFKGHDENSPEAFVLSPVTCMHCENAPCEQVCPVAATTHDDQGLNVMVYNRCVGTRYCSNNCPYKVRRFNYFDYHARGALREGPGILHVEPDYYTKPQMGADPLKQMQFNPEVTVRMRGIMEKCTYCVQRITNARIDAKNQWVTSKNLKPNDPAVQDLRVPILDGTVTPACAQACPAQAIVFGDLNDPGSRVSKLHKNPRTYQMLEELNPKPRTRYMAKIRNPAFGHETHASHGDHS
jgi:MoCo/4Fe-4S cofactor protein with predicted Tat translocation signal